MLKTFSERLNEFCRKNNLILGERISKGRSSEVFLVFRKKEKLALKIERDLSTRIDMAGKEKENLIKANKKGIAPKFFKADLKNRIILFEFIQGTTFDKWLESNPSKKDLKKFIELLFVQAKKLDEIGLDHGQLAGRGRNILVRLPEKVPVIIDFEKASSKRKAHNEKVLIDFLNLNPNSKIAEKVIGLLGEN